MARYDFFDPNQVNDFTQKARSSGKTSGEINAYIKSQRQQQQAAMQQDVGMLELENKKNELLAGPKAEKVSDNIKGQQHFAGLALDTLNQMKKIYGMGDAANVGTDSDLSQGEGALPAIGRGLETVAAKTIGYSTQKRQRAKEVQGMADLLLSQLTQSFGSGAPQEGEAQRLIDNMPTRTSTDQEASAWFNNVSTLLEKASGRVEAPGMGLGDSSPALNIKGEIAGPGDVMQDTKTGDMQIYGEPETKGTVFKKTKEGAEVDNSVIKFLAESSFLPIAGSVIGALAGVGVGSVATGAAGAVIGKTMQQGLRELFDPERQDMSDIAQAVVIEGVSDAIIGGVTFGVGNIAKGGLKLVLNKTAKEVAEEGAEQVISKGAKQTAVEGLTKTGLGLTPSKIAVANKSIKGDIVEEISGRGYKSIKEAADLSGKELTAATSKLQDLLVESGDVKTKEVVQVLQDAQYNFVGKGGDVIPTAETGVNSIQKWIDYSLGHGDTMTMTEVNKVKKGLQEAFPKRATDVTKSSQKAVTGASTMVREFIEKNGVEGIAGTNREIQITKFVREAAVNKLDSAKFKFIGSFVDLSMGISNPALLVGKKGIELFASQFDDLARAKIINEGLQSAAANNSKAGVRNVLRFASKFGMGLSAGLGAEAVTPETQPTQDPIQGPGMDLQPQGGKGMSLDDIVRYRTYR